MIGPVTGATAGFGRDRLEALADELGRDRCHPLPLNVSDRAAVAAAVAGLPPGFSGVAVLMNNAGLARGLEPAQEADLDD